jgi:hypothetical protein
MKIAYWPTIVAAALIGILLVRHAMVSEDKHYYLFGAVAISSAAYDAIRRIRKRRGDKNGK